MQQWLSLLSIFTALLGGNGAGPAAASAMSDLLNHLSD